MILYDGTERVVGGRCHDSRCVVHYTVNDAAVVEQSRVASYNRHINYLVRASAARLVPN